MKIDSEKLLGTVNQFRNEPVDKGESAATGGNKAQNQGSDRVELTTRTGEVDQVKKALQDLPDVQSDKVARLKEQVANGTYKVDGTEVAKKMVKNWRELNEKQPG